LRNRTEQIAAENLGPPESLVAHNSQEQVSAAAKRLDNLLEECRRTLGDVDPATVSIKMSAAEFARSLEMAHGNYKWTYYVAEGGSDHLKLQLQPEIPTTRQIQAMGLLSILGLLAATIWLIRFQPAADFICRWPHLLGVLLGVAYWAWMWPSWLGILIAGVNVWLAIRFDWPGRSLRVDPSTVLGADRLA
jgi:hypothetical protein